MPAQNSLRRSRTSTFGGGFDDALSNRKNRGRNTWDIPILLVIVSLGALRPSDWTQFVIGIVIAVAAASLLNYFIPRLYPWVGEEALASHSVGE